MLPAGIFPTREPFIRGKHYAFERRTAGVMVLELGILGGWKRDVEGWERRGRILDEASEIPRIVVRCSRDAMMGTIQRLVPVRPSSLALCFTPM